MKDAKNNLKNYFLYAGIFFLSLGVTSCDDDDDGVIDEPETEPTGSIIVEDQVISDNTVMIDQVTVNTDDPDNGNAWLVARHTNETGDILAQEQIEEGNHNDISLQLDDMGAGVDLQSGDVLVLMLYADDGDGNFDSTTDTMITDIDGDPVSEIVVVTSPEFSITDQQVIDNSVTYDNVSVNRDSYLVAYGVNEDGTINEDEVLGSVFVEPGNNQQDVQLTFEEDRVPTGGSSFVTRLHVDDPEDRQFTHTSDPDTDIPERFGFAERPEVEAQTNVLD